jgi:hypothetical protein
MVTKCANPECSSQFHYFHHGKLFVIEDGEKHKLNCYWLCEKCCSRLTIEREGGKGVVVKATVVNRARSAENKDAFRIA